MHGPGRTVSRPGPIRSEAKLVLPTFERGRVSKPGPRPMRAMMSNLRRHAAAACALLLAAGCGRATGQGDGRVVHRRKVEAECVAVERTVSSREAGRLVERRDAVVHVALRDAKTGTPLTDLQPFAWIDRQAQGESLAGQACHNQVQAYLQGKLFPDGSLAGHADVDLNSFYLLT